MIPVLLVSGFSRSGKTTFIEGLVRALSSRGLRIGYVKHCPHGFDPGEHRHDTGRVAKAGAEATCALSEEALALYSRNGRTCSFSDTARRYFSRDLDLVIAEGFKTSPHEKIFVVGEPTGGHRDCGNEVSVPGEDANPGDVKTSEPARVVDGKELPHPVPVAVGAIATDLPVESLPAWTQGLPRLSLDGEEAVEPVLESLRNWNGAPSLVLDGGHEVDLNDFVSRTLDALGRALLERLHMTEASGETVIVARKSEDHGPACATEVLSEGTKVPLGPYAARLVGSVLEGFVRSLDELPPFTGFTVVLRGGTLSLSSGFRGGKI